MSFSNRRFKLAVRGCLIAGALLVLSPLGAQENNPSHNPEAAPTQSAKENAAPKLALPSPRDGEQTVESDWNKPECGRAKSHDEADLCEQRRMAKAAEDAAVAADNAVYWSRLQFWVAFVGSAFLIWNLIFVRRSVKEATESNRLSREFLVADQRAYISVDLFADSDFTVGEEGVGINVRLRIRNTGKTSAHFVRTNMKMIASTDTAPQDVIDFAAENRVPRVYGSRSLSPQGEYDREWATGITIEEIKGPHPNRLLFLPAIIGCVTYQILPDKSLHQTAFVYSLSEGNEAGKFKELLSLGASRVSQHLVLVDVASGGFSD